MLGYCFLFENEIRHCNPVQFLLQGLNIDLPLCSSLLWLPVNVDYEMMLLISKQYLRQEIVITGGLQLTKRSLKNSGIVAHLWESFLSKNFKKRVVCLHSPYWESTVYFQIKSQFPELVFFLPRVNSSIQTQALTMVQETVFGPNIIQADAHLVYHRMA